MSLNRKGCSDISRQLIFLLFPLWIGIIPSSSSSHDAVTFFYFLNVIDTCSLWDFDMHDSEYKLAGIDIFLLK